MDKNIKDLTPSKIVAELDKFIIGQDDAKKAIAIAIRNRWRRQQLPSDIRDEVIPKNIIMIGATGVGKTEIARRLATLVRAPFIKVEATKFTEIGYVGRNVESIIQDLLEIALQMVRSEMSQQNLKKAEQAAEQRLVDYLMPKSSTISGKSPGQTENDQEHPQKKLLNRLRRGLLDNQEIEIIVKNNAMPPNAPNKLGIEQIVPKLQNFFEKIMPNQPVRRRVTVREARNIICQQELDKLVDRGKMIEQAIALTEQSGIVFLDELDKLCSSYHFGPDISREGVQRDLLPLVEGTIVNTNHGIIRTDHILFIAAGAFSHNEVSDLMPELYGRFPIQVKLNDLKQKDFRRILSEPSNALIKQQVALLSADGINLEFTDDGLIAMAEKAYEINHNQQNIGARRLHAVAEKILEQISFEAPDCPKKKYIIDAEYVNQHLSKAKCEEDLRVFGFGNLNARQKHPMQKQQIGNGQVAKGCG